MELVGSMMCRHVRERHVESGYSTATHPYTTHSTTNIGMIMKPISNIEIITDPDMKHRNDHESR
jgi:hypothetical protein